MQGIPGQYGAPGPYGPPGRDGEKGSYFSTCNRTYRYTFHMHFM